MRPVRVGPKTSYAIRVLPALMILLSASAVSGCGETIIDSSKMEAAVKSNVERSLHQKVTAVDCPSDQKVNAGETFTCTIEFSNGKHASSTWKIRNQEADVDIVGFKKTE